MGLIGIRVGFLRFRDEDLGFRVSNFEGFGFKRGPELERREFGV